MNQPIVIDGKVYNNASEMPPDVRRQYEEAMRNFTPPAMPAVQPLVGNVMSATKFVVNGQTYDSLDQLPPEARAKYEQAMGTLDTNRNGIPDFVEGMFQTPLTVTRPTSPESAAPLHSQPKPVPASIEPESSGGWLLVVVGIVFAGICLLAVAGGVWYFLFGA